MNFTYLKPNSLYMVEALGRFKILANIKLYNSSNNTILHRLILIIKNVFLFIFLDKYIHNGNITYISNKADIPKNKTLLRQTNPPRLP